MHRRLRADIVEGQREIIFEHLVARQFAAQDAREDVAIVIRLAGIDRHRRGSFRLGCGLDQIWRDAFSAMPEVPSRRSSSAMTSASGTFLATSSTIRWNKRSAASPTSAARSGQRGDHGFHRFLTQLLVTSLRGPLALSRAT